MTQRIVVLGGSGAVGTAVVGELRRLGHDAVTIGRDAARADVAVDVVRDPDGWRDALDGADAVVNASGLEDVRVAAVAHARGVPFVDISATGGYLEVLRAGLEAGGTTGVLVTDVGIAPGVSNVLAAEVHRRSPGPVDVGVVLGAGEHHGKAATRWTFDMLGRSFVDPATGRRVRNYTAARTFEVAGTRHHLVRADFADQHTMTRELGSPVRTYFGLDDASVTRTLTLATWVPGARRVAHLAPVSGGADWVVFARGGGVTLVASGVTQSLATGRVTAAVALRAAALPPGAHGMHDVLTLDDLRAVPGLSLSEESRQDVSGRGA